MHVELSRSDLVKVNLALIPRVRATWVSWALLAVCVGALLLSAVGVPSTGSLFALMLVVTLLVPAIVLAFVFCVAIGFTLLVSSEQNGVLGEHTYTFQDDGLRERTAANDTLIKWGGVREVRRTSGFIMIGVSFALYHVLPRRCFESAAHYDSFWRHARRLKQKTWLFPR